MCKEQHENIWVRHAGFIYFFSIYLPTNQSFSVSSLVSSVKSFASDICLGPWSHVSRAWFANIPFWLLFRKFKSITHQLQLLSLFIKLRKYLPTVVHSAEISMPLWCRLMDWLSFLTCLHQTGHSFLLHRVFSSKVWCICLCRMFDFLSFLSLFRPVLDLK